MCCDDLEAWGGGGRSDVCMIMADLRCCTSETNTFKAIFFQLKILKRKEKVGPSTINKIGGDKGELATRTEAIKIMLIKSKP